jgi:chemotaxis response regulator CheB
VVFGMPSVAIEMGAAVRVMSLDHIPGELVNYFATNSGVNQRDTRKESV